MHAAGKNIKAFRVNNGISQEDFAQKIDVAQTTVSAWERGIATPRAINVSRIIEAYPVLTYDLIVSDDNGYQRQALKTREKADIVFDNLLLELCKIWQIIDIDAKGTLISVARALKGDK